MKKWLLSGAAFLVCFAISLALGFFLALFVIGPHSDMPKIVQVPGMFLLYGAVLGIPFKFSRWIFKKLQATEKYN